MQRLQGLTWVERLTLVGVLPCVAGLVNASGLLEVGQTTSHVTGNTTRVGLDLAQGDLVSAEQIGLLIGCFFLGALLASVLVDGGLASGRYRYAIALLLEVGVLGAFSWLALEPAGRASPGGLAAVLGVGMGLQNGLITRVSGAVVRTTHLTGVVTDIAIETVRVLRFLWARATGRASGPLRGEPDWVKLRLHLTLLGAFFSGTVLGPLCVGRLGPLWTLVPASLLLVLVVVDVVAGIGRVSAPAA